MHESKRTLIYVATALVTVALAAGTHWAMRPVSLEEFSDVGEEFYPEFKDPNAATGLRVAAYNEDAARVDVFNVEFKDGLWRIPSHHNYPADGEERLAKTASSLIGIKRDALVSTSADDFRRLGVLDPLDETVTGTTGRGDRITLLQGDAVLADYIIGTKVEDQENVYHVRKPDENRTYRAELDIDISTRFADWIEPDLLKVTRGDLREIEIDRYSVDETRGVIVPGDVTRLRRESSTASWEMEGLAENEKVKTSEVNAIINALEDLTIVGVRPKPAGLSADLKGEGGAKLDSLAMIDLQNKGYFVDSQGALVSNEGEVRVGTAEGVLYVLRFGEVFTGSDVEIEVGQSTSANAAEPVADAEDASADETQEADEQKSAAQKDDDDGEKGNSSQKQSRYLFITTQFHKELIPPPGEKPVEPEKPAGLDDGAADPGDEPDDGAAEDSTNDSNPADNGSDEATDDPADSEEGEDATEGAEKQEADGEDEQSPEEKAYQQALAEYRTNLENWEREQKEYEEKLEKGRERVKELNARFADWYYVISAETFDKIRTERAKLVEPKEPEAAKSDDTESDPGRPAIEPASPDEESPNEKDDSPADAPQSDAPQPDAPSVPESDPSNTPPDDSPPQESTPPAESPAEGSGEQPAGGDSSADDAKQDSKPPE